MSDFDKCKICGKYGWIGSHRCPPQFNCKIIALNWHGEFEPQEEGYQAIIREEDPQTAVIEFVKRYESADSDLDVASGDLTIKVEVLPIALTTELEELIEIIDSSKSEIVEINNYVCQHLQSQEEISEDIDRLKELAEAIANSETRIKEIEAQKRFFVVAGEVVPQYYVESEVKMELANAEPAF